MRCGGGVGGEGGITRRETAGLGGVWAGGAAPFAWVPLGAPPCLLPGSRTQGLALSRPHPAWQGLSAVCPGVCAPLLSPMPPGR